MPEVLESAHGVNPSNDRRRHTRRRLQSLTYAELDEANGGIVLDASENGISIQAVAPLVEDTLPRLRLKLPEHKAWLETAARVVWTQESRKVAGLQFDGMPEDARNQLQAWLSKETIATEETAPPSATSGQPAAGNFPSEPTSPATGRPKSSPVGGPARIRFSVLEAGSDAGTADALRQTIPFPAEKKSKHPPVETNPRPAVKRTTTNTAGAVGEPAPSQTRQIAQPMLLREEARSSAPIYWLVIALAVGSLGAGWIVGRGKLDPFVENIRDLISQNKPAEHVAIVEDAKPEPPVGEIEIVDANGNRRMIPLAAEPSEREPAKSQPTANANAASPAARPAVNFQTWALTPSRPSVGPADAAAINSGAPPAIAGGKSTPDIEPIEPSAITVARPEAPPKPAPKTGDLKRGALIHRVEPIYPEIARQQHVSGTVKLEATIGADGAVRDVRILSGPKLLAQSALDAVRQWRYAPTLLDGKAIETQVEISLVFGLPDGGV